MSICLNNDYIGADMEVYFGNFWADVGNGSSCQKILLEKNVNWHGYGWRIPAMYLCEEGVMVDICRIIPMDRVRLFYNRWSGVNGDSLSEEQVECLMEESPLEVNATFTLEAGRTLESGGWSSVVWQNIRPELSDPVTEELMREYRCEKENAWQFIRLLSKWKKERARPQEVQLIFRSLPDRFRVPEHFVTGDKLLPQMEFRNPWSGSNHVLKVMECKGERLKDSGQDEAFKYPSRCRIIRYTVSPPLVGASLLVRDVKEGDRAISLKEGKHSSAIAVTFNENDKLHKEWKTACSSVYFREQEETEWRMELHGVREPELTVTIPFKSS